MKTYEKVELRLHVSLTTVVYGREWLVVMPLGKALSALTGLRPRPTAWTLRRRQKSLALPRTKRQLLCHQSVTCLVQPILIELSPFPVILQSDVISS
jgi:hypothetical protein